MHLFVLIKLMSVCDMILSNEIRKCWNDRPVSCGKVSKVNEKATAHTSSLPSPSYKSLCQLVSMIVVDRYVE